MSLLDLIVTIREQGPEEGVYDTGFDLEPTGDSPLVVSIYRFQSYRARTQHALVQELEDYIFDAGLKQLHWKVINDTVILW